MSHVSCPPTSRRSSGRRLGLALAAAAAGIALYGLLPTSAMAASPHTMRGPMGSAHATGMVMADAAPTPTASMSPHAPTEVQAGPALTKVLQGLMCRCGCNLTVFACEGTMTCEVSAKMRADAERLLVSGKTADQVLAAFAADYGEQVLASPTKKGFNLTAWVLPFVVLGVGGLVVAFALRSWRPRPQVAEGEELPPVDAKYLAEVEEELKREE